MKFIGKICKHKIIIGVCMLVASITALTAVLVPAFTANMNSNDDSHLNVATDPVSDASKGETEEAYEIEPNHDYSSVMASLNSGAKIYVGVTTASDLKNNLNVTGTFTSGDASVTANLKKKEYTLQVAIGSFVKNLSENDVILDVLPEDSDQVNLIVKVKRTSGEVSSSFTIPVGSIAEAEEFEAFEAITSITVENVASITNDYDKEALKNILVVKGNDGNVIQNKELYDVTFLSNLIPGNGATFQVTYKAGNTTLPPVTGTIRSVTQATILAADFSVNPNYRLDGMYYKKQSTEAGESDKWFSAFVAGSAGIAGSTLEDIYGDGLKLTVHYPNSSRTLSFSTFGENSSTADTNEYVVFNTTSFVENANEITASVYNHIGGQSVNVSISINFELAKILEIKAEGYNKNVAGLVSSGLPDTTFFMQDMDRNISYVKTRANTGVWSENYLTISGFSVSGTLTPTADVIAQAANMTPDQLATFKYKKDITIIYNEDESITATYPVDVLYEAPSSVYRVNVKNNKFPNQTMRTPFNFGDLYVVLQYGEDGDIDIEVPLTEFLDAAGNSEHIRIELYSDTGRTQLIGSYVGETPTITKEVQGIKVSFRYDVNGAWCTRAATGSRPGMSVTKYVVSLPTFDTRTISFSTDTTKSIIFNSSIEQEILNGLELRVYDDENYTTLTEFAEYNQTGLSISDEIRFLAGGKKYYIELRISDEIKDEVEWSHGEGVSGNVVRYVVEISKGPITPVVVSYGNGTWGYGDTPETPTITGTRVDGSTLNIVYGSGESDISSPVLKALYEIRYYLKTQTGWDSNYLTDTLPVGEYYVQVIIPDTTNYLEAVSTPGPGYGCPTIKVTPALLSPNNLLPNITFDGQSRDGDDFVTGATGIKYGDTGVIEAGSLTSLTPGIPLTSDNKALHAGKYSVKLTIAAAYKDNYAWSDDVTVNAEDNSVTQEFEIYQRKLGYDITNESSLGFTYGDTTLPTPIFGYSDNYDAVTSPSLSATKPSLFFAIEGTIKYYNSSNVEVLASDFAKWPVGSYTVKCELSSDTNHLASDYTLPIASATFEVSQKGIDLIADASVSSTYSGSLWNYTIIGWNPNNDNNGDPILTGTLIGSPFDSTGVLNSTITNLNTYDTAFDASTGVISVLHAGEYKFTISLNSNYKWNVAAGETAPEADPVITLTMNQKVLAGSLSPAASTDDYEWNKNSFKFDPLSTTGQETPTLTMKGVAAADNIQLKYTLHYVSDDTEVVNKATMIAADYYYLLTGWTGNTNTSGYNLANNYKFPTDKKIVTFTVQSSALEDVALAATLSGVYKGNNYDFTTFITNISDFLYGTSNTSKLVYYVQSSSSNNTNATSLDGIMSPLMTDTGSYTIYIYPAANFAWKNAKAAFGTTAPAAIQDKEGYVVTFTITEKALTEADINWGTTTFTYNGKEQAAQPIINSSSLLNTADSDVKLADILITAGTSTGTTAGKYTATLNGFVSTSTRAFNYTIGSFTQEITINPYQLDDPTMSTKVGTFNGKNQELTITLPTASGVIGYNANTLITGTVLGGWEAVGTTAHQASYADGKFTFLNAGAYQITFALTDTQNYEWKNGTAPVLSDIKISRLEIVAPVLGDNRTMEYNGTARYPMSGSSYYVTIDNTKYPFTISGNTASVTVDGHTISWNIVYASYEGSFDYVTDSIEPIEYGTYYIQFNILDASNQSHLNYIWVENDDDTTKLDFMQNLYGDVKQSAEDGTALFLAYMITRKLFQPKLEALNSGKYVFGDNGLAGTYTQDDDLSKAVNFIHLAAGSDTTTVLNENPTITYKLYSLTSLDSNFELVEDALMTEADLVNGLPWNKGYYGMYVLIDFTHGGADESQFENIPLKYAFEVQTREVTVTWSAVDSSGVTAKGSNWEMDYTSNTYNPADLLAAEVTNLAKKDASDTPVAPTMTITANPTTIKNVGTYTFTVAITGTDVNSKNYTVKAGETSVTTSLEINPVTLDLKGVLNAATFEYGTTLALTGTDWWDYAADSATICSNDTASDIVSYEIINTGNKYSVGTYDVEIKLANGVTNYVLSDDTASAKGSIEVVAREITLVLDASDGKTTSVYQKNAITLGTPYSVTYNGNANSNDWLVSGDTLADIFTLKLMNGTEDVTTTEYNPVGTYSIEVIKGIDTNYIVNVSTSRLVDEDDHATLGDYTITNATLSVDAILGNVDAGISITYDSNPYEWIKAIEDQTRVSLITYEGLNGVNLDNNNVVWTITKKNTTDIVSGTTTNAFAQTTYIVTVSADNHTATTGVEVVVEIEKAVLKIAVNFTSVGNRIYYGEELPTVDTEGYNDLSSDIYNITGFFGSDDASVIRGTFTFASSDYKIWDSVGNYTTTIDVSNLTSTNYTFEASEGAIRVIALPLTITIPSLTNVYIQDVASMESTDSLVVEAFADLYDKLTVAIGNSAKDRVSAYLQEGYSIVDIVNLMTDALIQDGDGNITATNDVNTYPFYLVAADGDLYSNYNITVSTTANGLTVPSGAVNNKTAAFTITEAENKFADVFGFAGVDPLTTTIENIVAAWVYGVNVDGGYNATTHQINLPATKFNSVPGSTSKNESILYKLYYLSDSNWFQLGADSYDIEALFAEQLAAGHFNAANYKVEYILEGNDNYSDVSDTRYFEVTPRDLYIWAKDAETYFGEDFVRDVLTSGLVDNGSSTIDTLAEVATLEYVYDYVAGATNAGKAYYSLQEKTQEEKYNNYVIHWNYNGEDEEEVDGEINVLPRPVVITIATKTSQYNFNNKPGAGETLSFTAQLGTNELGIEFASTSPFFGTARTQFNNDTIDNNFITLYTNALLDGDIKTQNVGNYAIFAVYKNDLAKQNYAITIATEYSRDEALEDKVNEYFTTDGNTYDFYGRYIEGYYNDILSDLMISTKDGDNYKAGTYKITSSSLTLTMTLPDPTYDGERKSVTLNGDVPSDPFGLVSYKAQYDYNYGKAESLYLDEAPVNVGTYPVRVVVQNPNYSFDAGGLANAVVITKRELDWNASINDSNNLSKATAYGDASTMYLGVGNANQLDINFNNIYTNSAVTEESGLDARLKFIMTVSGKAISGTNIAAAYSEEFVLEDYDIDAATYTLLAQHSGVYTVTLKLDGTEAQNYKFPSAYLKAGTTDTYEFTFTIRRSDKASTVSAQNTQVQYGTPITANGSTTNPDLFGGFKLDTATLALIAAENEQLAGTSDASKVTYTATYALNQSIQYNPATSTARTNYQVQPDGLWFYNYEVRYNRNAVMTVNPREIVVVIAGAESNNSYASVTYSGELQGPDHSEVAASQKYFVPQDLEGGIKWYGEAVSDKNKNYAELFNYYLNLFAGANTGVDGGKGLEADTYYIKVNGTGLTNYSVTFQNKAGDELTTTEAAIETAPTYVIQKKKLQVQVGSTGLNNTEAFATSFTIPYGNTLVKSENTYYYLTAEYYGLVDRDNTASFINAANAKLMFTTQKISGNGTASYVPWDSHAGSKYTISPVEFDFDNYEVTDWLTATMEVVSRLVTATTENRTYTEYRDNGVINYQQGRQGAYHAAQIVFADYDPSLYNTDGSAKYYTGEIQKDAYGVILSGIINNYTPKYTLSYVNIDDNTEVISAQGPRMVGKYNATVTMTSDNGNYDYKVVSQGSTSGSSNTTLSYAVNKKKLTIRWNTVDSDYLNYNTGDDKQREILDFIAEIMSVNQITRQFTNTISNEQEVEYILEALGLSEFMGGSYYIDSTNTKVLIKIYGIGLYTATVSISPTAVRNYEWRDASGASGTEFTLAFRVATSSITIDSLTFGDGVWSYGEKAPDVDFSTNVSGVGLLYQYAAIDSIPDTFEYTLGTMIEDSSLAQYLELHNHGYSMTMPTDAGLYVMYAWYPGSDQYQMSVAYLVFEIEKAILQTPDLINLGLEFKDEDGKKVVEMTYTGNVLQLELGYDTKLLDINYAGSMSAPTSGRGMILLATDVTDEGYAVSFTLSDAANYAWDQEAFGEFVWKIIPAEDNTIESFDFDELLAGLIYGDSYTDPTASATYSSDVIIEYFVNDEWVTTKPDQAGTYKVRAVSPATKNYYAGTKDQPAISEEVTFTIGKKDLYVKASGSMTYGDEFNTIGGSAYSYQFTGFIHNDTDSKVIVNQIEYMLVDAPAKLEFGTYKVRLVEADGEVIGMTADNYKIIAEEGEFSVLKRDVMVVLGVASSVYGEKVDLSKVSMEIVGTNQLVPGDEFKDLNIQLSINSTGFDMDSIYNPATSYKVDAEGHTSSKNYNVTVYGSGVYTITPLSIYITVEAGGGVFQGTITPVKLTGIYTTDGDKNVLEMFDGAHAPGFTFNYWGISNDGTWSHTNADRHSSEPTLAGNYYATAVATQSTNYRLDTTKGTPSVSFVVEKKTLDDTNREVLFANPIEYTGSVVLPVITDLAFEGLYHTGATNYATVGSYIIPLTLKDSANYKWASVDSATCEIPFEIVRSNNAFEGEVSIQDWVYGNYDPVKNLPSANIKFGSSEDFTYSYSDKEDGTYTANVPTNAGTYWVKITAPQTDNYYSVTSEAKEFHIAKATITAPTLVIVSDGDSQNTTYTGSRLQAVINGYNSSTMHMVYDGDSSFGNTVSIFALNADTYVVRFVLNDSDNYTWADSTTLVDGDATLYWSIARKQIAKPTMNTNMFMVNGGTLTFIPVGFDEETMNIEGNKTTYGGSFKVTVSIKDKTNYEWADSTTEDIVFDWFVVGWDTVFIIVLSVLGVVAGIAGIAIVIQYVLHRRKKKRELEDELAAQGLFDENMDLMKDVDAAEASAKESKDGGNNNE